MIIPIKGSTFFLADNAIRKEVYQYIRDVYFPTVKKKLGVDHDFYYHVEVFSYTADGVTVWFSYASGEDGEMTIPDCVFIDWKELNIQFNG